MLEKYSIIFYSLIRTKIIFGIIIPATLFTITLVTMLAIYLSYFVGRAARNNILSTHRDNPGTEVACLSKQVIGLESDIPLDIKRPIPIHARFNIEAIDPTLTTTTTRTNSSITL